MQCYLLVCMFWIASFCGGILHSSRDLLCWLCMGARAAEYDFCLYSPLLRVIC